MKVVKMRFLGLVALVILAGCSTTKDLATVVEITEPQIIGGGTELSLAEFTSNGDGTVSDESSELMWQSADDGVQRDGLEALLYCEKLNLAGHKDWRLPTAKELTSLSADQKELFALTGETYYTSTHETVYLSLGQEYGETPSEKAYVLCVRAICDRDYVAEAFKGN